MASDTEITKVRIVIRHLLWQIREIRNDRDAAWNWINRFANTLQYQELEQDPDQYALAILAEARSFNDQQRRKGQMLVVRKQMAKEGVTNPTQEQLDEKWLDMYGQKFTQDAPNGNAGDDRKVETSCNQFTADGNTREDSQAIQDGSAITRNETRHLDALDSSANHYTADASEGDLEVNPDGQQSTQAEAGTSANHYATRQAKNGDAATSDGADESTTVSRNMRRVPQNGSPAHGFSGGRTAQGTMSRSPEAAAQSGKASALDGLTDKDGQSAKTRDNRASGRYAPPSCSPEDGNHYDQDPSTSADKPQPEGLTGPSHGGSVASLEARESQARQSRQRTGGSSVRGMAKVEQPSVRPRASFRNKEEFIQWSIDDGLDPVDANECWEATEERGGKDADGNTVKNMKAFARQWCRTRKINRRTA